MELIVKHRDREAEVHLEHTAAGYYLVIGGETYDVDVVDVGDGVRSLVFGGRQFVVAVKSQGNGHYRVGHAGGNDAVELMDPLTHLAQKAHGSARGGGAEQIRAYMPGRVIKILVTEGDAVEPGQGVVVLEAMKMENEIQAEHAGTIRRVAVEEGQAVEGGDVLFELE